MRNFEPNCTTQAKKRSPITIEISRRDERNQKVIDYVSDKAINGAWTKAKDVKLFEVG